MLAAGNELATAASKALGTEMKFENISECVNVFQVQSPFLHHTDPSSYRSEAKRVLKSQSDSDQSELQYLLEYYSLVREGKTNYISTTAFHDVTGSHPTEPDEFFRMYQDELRPNKKVKRSHNHHK